MFAGATTFSPPPPTPPHSHPATQASRGPRLGEGSIPSKRQFRRTTAAECVMDPITIGIIRNKVASLVEEMHYHFYRSGYSTIIRESRDFSCVIVDRAGRLIVPPPMFFHAPVYRHLVGRIIDLYGKEGRIG